MAATAKLPKLPEPTFDLFTFEGGVDTETPPWSIKPGFLRDAINYEIAVGGGYVDVTGYERFDGQFAPSNASYSILYYTLTGAIAVGDTVTGGTSLATGVVIAVVAAATPVNAYLVLTKTTGTFQDGEDIENAGVQGVAIGASVAGGALTNKLAAQYLNLAADEYRSDILAVPGSGSILGVWVYNDIVYAVRNAVGGATAEVYKSSVAGWVNVPLGRELEFTAGGSEISEGDVITGGTSGSTATVTRVCLETGSWTGGDAQGRLIFASQSGPFQAETLLVSAVPSATIAGNSTAITLLPGGRFEVDIRNLGGQLGTKRVYGCDRVNRGFEFDGTVWAPINTGMAVDAPTHVCVHKSQVFFSFGSSAQHSGIGEAFKWNPVFGAAELAVGDTVTGFLRQPGAQGDAALAISCLNHFSILYGNNVGDWNLVPYRDEIGAREYTAQDIGYSVFLDEQGIRSLRTAQEFGNFSNATLSTKLQTFINAHQSSATASCVSRKKNQYRVFFTDNYALYMTFDGSKIRGIMPVLLSHRVTAIYSAELSNGAEGIFFGSTDGRVYQMEKGTSFDGAAIAASITTHFHYSKSLGYLKSYFPAVIEARGFGYAEFDFSYELGYSSAELAQPRPVTNILALSTVVWDEFVWDEFIWDGVSLSPSRCEMTGTAENVSITIRKSSDYFSPMTLTGVRLRIVPRRMVR